METRNSCNKLKNDDTLTSSKQQKHREQHSDRPHATIFLFPSSKETGK